MESGVQELIDKLQSQGAAEGQKRAEQIIKEAQAEASRLIKEAKAEADKIFSDAQRKIETERASAHAAIQVAFRDSELALRSQFKDTFSQHLKKLVSAELRDKEIIRQLILLMASSQSAEVAATKKVEISIPSALFEKGETGPQLSQKGKENLHHLILGITSQMLREGVELKAAEEVSGGIRVALVGEDIEIDLTDNALSNLMLKYILPRYRAIISGQG
jgi:V/A-type H+/Na+-transporting ATPase subunit E